MSKIGAKAIAIEGAKVTVEDRSVVVTGPKGTVTVAIPRGISIAVEGNTLNVKRANDTAGAKAFHGLTRSLIANAVHGVVTAWEKKVEVVGTGFGVSVKAGDAVFKVGFSHQVTFKKQDGLIYSVDGTTILTIAGANKQQVGEAAFLARKIKPPDAYKGKGIRYLGEVIKLKPGKKAKTA